MVNITPVAADDAFTALQGAVNTTITGNLGGDNGFGLDYDPDGSVLGWAGLGFNPVGDGDRYLGAFFSNGTLGFLSLSGTVSYPFPVFSSSLLLTTAQGGQVFLNTSGSFTYVSAAGFSGVDWVDYTLVDAMFGTDIGRVTFTVIDTAAGNDPPVAMDDTFTGSEDSQITGNVLADNGNGPDTDPNGDTLTVVNRTLYTQQGGIVSILANGSFTYTPRTNYTGPDSFTYTVKDPFGASDIGTVTINLTAVNDAPAAIDDGFTARHGGTISGNVLSNNGNGADSDADGDPLAVVAATLTTSNGGQVVLNADGSFSYSANPAFVGSDSFTYVLEDGQGGSDTATVTLDLTNTAPIAAADWFSTPFDKALSGNVLANNGYGADSDPDGEALTVAAGRYATAQGGTVTLNANGNFAFTPGEAFYGTDSFTYTINDGFGGNATGTVLINVTAPIGSVYGTAADESRTGSTLADAIFGLDGDDSLSGLGGHDTLVGGDGKDLITGAAGADRLYGQADGDLLQGGQGADYLSGGQGTDDFYGNEGNDILLGGAGNDTLFGGGGLDRFIFGAADGQSRDKVMDFAAGDKLAVYAADYGLAAGPLANSSYFALAGAAAVGHGRFVYTAATRSLSWDADGNAATADVEIAVFNKAVVLSYTDFLVL